MNAQIRNDVSDIHVAPLSRDSAAFRAAYLLELKAEGFGFQSEGLLSGVAIRREGKWRFLMGAFSQKPEAGAR